MLLSASRHSLSLGKETALLSCFFFSFAFFLLLFSSKTNSQALFEFEFSAASVAKNTQGEMIGEINYDISTFIKITTAS